MHVEYGNVEDNRDEDEADGPGRKVLEGVGERPVQVAQDVPELADGENAHVEDDK